MLKKRNVPARGSRMGMPLRETLLAATALGAMPALAQDTPAPETAELVEIVVTGTRAARDGYQAPSPTNVINAAVIDNQAATGLGEILEQTGMVKGTRNPNSNAVNTASPGQWTADLRGLGGQRTLVLVDSSRIVPFAPASNLSVPTTTDLNLIPTLMVERVETVTGGASAQYGSDAVSGVVNILLRREFDGVRVRAQTGISEEGDAEENRVGVLGGWNSDSGRAHVVFSADWVDSEGMGDIYTRDWGRRETMIVSTPGNPSLTWGDNVHTALGVGGVIGQGRNAANTANAAFTLTGQTFNPDGSIRPFQYGYPLAPGATSSTMIGGEGESITKGVSQVPGVERASTYARFGFDFSDRLYGYASLGYSQSKGLLTAAQPRLTSTQLFIRADNAFLPTAVRDAMTAQGVGGFRMTRQGNDLGNNSYDVENKSPRFSAGLEGSFANGWDWDAHVSYGRNDYNYDSENNPITANLAFAVDAVRDGNGNIVCAATIPGHARFNAAAAGCVPLNLFGEGNTSAEARDYFQGNPHAEVVYKQKTFGANLSGKLFATWAGPIAVATGVEYRDEEEDVTADPIATAGGFFTGNNSPYSGSFDVSEGYVEAIVPLARENSFAKLIDLNLAYRYADYSTVGGMEAWKTGLVWEPFDFLRLRVSQSRDIRAPAINELYSPGAAVTNNITMININDLGTANPTVRNYVIPQRTAGGDVNVQAEEGDTTTIGFVFSPNYGPLTGFNFSADYYDIQLDKAITNLNGANIANLCISGVRSFCNLFTFNAAGDPTALNAGSINLGSFEQRGYDLQLDYSHELFNGTWTIGYTGTFVTDSIVDTGLPGAVPVDRAGEHGAANFAAVPDFRGNLTTSFKTHTWSTTLQAVHVSAGKLDNLYNTPGNPTISKNDIPSYVLFNVYGSYTINDRVRLFGSIRNALNRDPVMTPYTVLNTPVYGAYYDKVGRQYSLGLDVTF
ncbi:TonB-dependent receptor plug domain-containing protein [Peristeroidobacter soli]|uniref:TonB-dependent receptor plug domain-containing protein n=1 Tax=Peristeroidobacter soli TaxID=2497877 RepID=UPI00101CA94D|nr:TonB-dependent receptor [Peristeroidobacter soli]